MFTHQSNIWQSPMGELTEQIFSAKQNQNIKEELTCKSAVNLEYAMEKQGNCIEA